MPATPFPLRAGKITSIMATARFLSQQRAIGDQERRLDHVRFFRRPLRQPGLDPLQFFQAEAEPFGGSIDSAVVPHDLADIVRGHLRRATVAQNGDLPFLLSWRGARLLQLDHVARYALSED